MRSGVVALVLTALALATPTPSAAPALITIDQARPAPGERITVRLTGWPAGTVSMEVCGNSGQRGSADCALENSVQTYVPAAGTASANLTVTAPPVGCPCVLRVTAVAGTTSGTVPLAITGMPAAAPPPAALAEPAGGAELTITGLEVIDEWSWTAVFGGPSTRTLLIAVRNDGTAPAVEPAVTVTLGRGDEPTGFVPPPLLDTLDPGEQRVVRLPVTLPAPAFGDYTVRGEISGTRQPARFSATITSYPWALLGIAAAIVAVLVLIELHRTRKRRSVDPVK